MCLPLHVTLSEALLLHVGVVQVVSVGGDHWFANWVVVQAPAQCLLLHEDFACYTQGSVCAVALQGGCLHDCCVQNGLRHKGISDWACTFCSAAPNE